MLKYIGNGASIPNVPARDLSADEVEQYGGERFLLVFGLWERVKVAKAVKVEPAETA